MTSEVDPKVLQVAHLAGSLSSLVCFYLKVPVCVAAAREPTQSEGCSASGPDYLRVLL